MQIWNGYLLMLAMFVHICMRQESNIRLFQRVVAVQKDSYVCLEFWWLFSFPLSFKCVVLLGKNEIGI